MDDLARKETLAGSIASGKAEKIHEIQKRPPCKPYQRKTDIYVTNKSNFTVFVYNFLRLCQ